MDKKTQLRDCLKRAREAIDKKDFKTALEQGRNALEIDAKNYNALVFVGVANSELDETKKAEQAYKKATTLDPTNLIAWQVLLIVVWAKVFLHIHLYFVGFIKIIQQNFTMGWISNCIWGDDKADEVCSH